MKLKTKVAVVYGGGGAIGGAIARTLAEEGAQVHLVGRTRAKLEAVARGIAASGGTAHVAALDALDEGATARHAAAVVDAAGRLDVAVNALGLVHVQGKALLDLSLEEYEAPIVGYARAQFVIARAVVPHMVAQKRGVILSLSTTGAVRAYPGVLGFGSACAAMEAFARHLACELGPSGVRVVCIRPDAVPETLEHGSHARTVFGEVADRLGVPLATLMKDVGNDSVLRRAATLDEVARTAAFLASDGAGAITATTINVSCGTVVG